MANMNLPFQIAQSKLNPEWNCAINVGDNMSAHVSTMFQVTLALQANPNALLERDDWQDIESRQAYMEACVEQDIAWQISINRKARHLTQKQMAESIGTTQTSIARWEDPSYGKHSISALIKIAHVFDCALMVRLVPYSKLAEITKDTSDSAYLAKSYELEIQEITQL